MSSTQFRLLLCCICAVWICVFVVMPPGLQGIDDFIYVSGFHAITSGDLFSIENGYDLFESTDLKLTILRDGPNGLAIQYPSGFSLLAAPFWLFAGVKGIFLLNLFAALGFLSISYALIRELSDIRTTRVAISILATSTFLVDYSSAIWPHSISIFFAILAINAVVKAVNRPGISANQWFAVGGLMAGIGLNMRTDVVLVLPPLIVWTLLIAPNPIRMLLYGFAGFFPPLFLSSWINSYKFGSWFPLSYGGGGGGTDPSQYYDLMLGIVLFFAFVYCVRYFKIRPYPATLAVACGLSGAALVFPLVGNTFLSALRGFYVLGIDLTMHKSVGISPSVVDSGGGVVKFFNTHKKALAQSMPWLFLLALALACDREQKRSRFLAWLVCIMVMLPFAMREWHGGGGNSQRYLLVILPFLSYLAARGLICLAPRDFSKGPYIFAGTLTAAQMFLLSFPHIATALLQQVIPKYLFFLGMFASVLFVLSKLRLVASLILFLSWVSLGLAFFGVYRLDLARTMYIRGVNLDLSTYVAKFPENTLVHSVPLGGVSPILIRRNSFVGDLGRSPAPDWKLFADVFDNGLWVATTNPELRADIAARFNLFENLLIATDDRGVDYFIMRTQPMNQNANE